MFQVGEKVVYPVHGVGTIVRIEEKEVLGKKQLYYFIDIDQGNMTVMVPVEQSDKVRLRKIQPDDSMDKVIEILNEDCENIHLEWKIRYSNNQIKLKEGSIRSLSEVVRDLFHRNHIKELSRGEKKLYDSAIQLLCDELSCVEKKKSDIIKNLIIDELQTQISVTV